MGLMLKIYFSWAVIFINDAMISLKKTGMVPEAPKYVLPLCTDACWYSCNNALAGFDWFVLSLKMHIL